MKQLNVFPECYVDTNLVGYIVGTPVKHKSSCNEVVKAVNNADFFAVGIIDADKRMPTFDAGFHKHEQQVPADGENKHITMYAHEDLRRFIFTIKPAMEKFILDAAKDQNVDLNAAGYPADLEGFKKITKRIQAASDPSLVRLFTMVKDNPEMQQFRNTLKYLMTNLDRSEIEVTKKFFDGILTREDLQGFLL